MDYPLAVQVAEEPRRPTLNNCVAGESSRQAALETAEGGGGHAGRPGGKGRIEGEWRLEGAAVSRGRAGDFQSDRAKRDRK